MLLATTRYCLPPSYLLTASGAFLQSHSNIWLQHAEPVGAPVVGWIEALLRCTQHALQQAGDPLLPQCTGGKVGGQAALLWSFLLATALEDLSLQEFGVVIVWMWIWLLQRIQLNTPQNKNAWIRDYLGFVPCMGLKPNYVFIANNIWL